MQSKKHFTFLNILLLGDFPKRGSLPIHFSVFSCQVANIFLSDRCPVSCFRVFLFLVAGDILTMYTGSMPNELIIYLFCIHSFVVYLVTHLFNYYFADFCKCVTFFHCDCNFIIFKNFIRYVYMILLYQSLVGSYPQVGLS